MVPEGNRILASLLIAGALLQGAGVSAADFKSVRGGVKDATEVIQKAIDKCAEAGGGQVVIPPGDYLCTPIVLRSNVDLYLSRGARIMGSTDYRGAYDISGALAEDEGREAHFAPKSEHALIFGKNIENVTISGEGTIDGQSNLVDFNAGGFKDNDGRPYAVLFKQCRNIAVRDIAIENSAFWSMRIQYCEKVRIDGVRINSMHFRNNDGIDIDARDVVVSNCIIDAEDDGICLKSDSRDFIPENIAITNCVVSSNCNPIKFGTASYGGWRNVTISNCVIRPTRETHFRTFHGWYRNVKPGYLGGMAGIAIECADGGTVENINVSDITMSGVITPVFILLNRRHGAGTISDVNISNITAYAEGVLPCMVCGIPEKKVSNVRLSNINIVQRGGENVMTTPLKEAPTAYPENRMFGHFNPACGLYLRHVDGIIVDNMRVRLLEQDHRPCVVMDDVTGESFTNMTCAGTDGAMYSRQ